MYLSDLIFDNDYENVIFAIFHSYKRLELDNYVKKKCQKTHFYEYKRLELDNYVKKKCQKTHFYEYSEKSYDLFHMLTCFSL